jgi:hypothetical protein
MNEDDCFFVSSRGIIKSCDIKNENIVSSSDNLPILDNLFENCTLYICNSAIKKFSLQVKEIKHNFILVSGDSDEEIYKDIFTNETDFLDFISNENIRHWFCQNCTYKHSKLTNLPIGLDYHSTKFNKGKSPDEQEKLLLNIRTQSQSFEKRIKKCYINFKYPPDFYRYAFDRIEALNNIPENLCYKEKENQERDVCWKNQSSYSFVISPFGNGLDCHRTWEAMILGCIPIIKSSGMDDLFIDLPVLIVKNWKEVNEELLESTITLFKDRKFNYDKLELSYWINLINLHSETNIEEFSNIPNTSIYFNKEFVYFIIFILFLFTLLINRKVTSKKIYFSSICILLLVFLIILLTFYL